MKIKIFNRYAAALLMVAATLSSCITDKYSDGGECVTNEMMTIRIAVPGNPRPATRALETADEFGVNEVVVLAFDSNSKKFHGRYTGIVTNGPTGTPLNGPASATMTFQVSLPLGDFDLMVVANAGAMLNAASATLVNEASRSDVLEAVKMTMGTSGWEDDNTAPAHFIPMWGYKTAVDVPDDFSDANTTLPDAIALTRMVAKVDLSLGDDLVDAEKFELQSVRVYNYIEQGRLIPDLDAFDWDNVTPATLSTHRTPTLPTGYTRADSDTEFIDYTLAEGATSLKGSIYLFEAPMGVGPVAAPEDYIKNTCLVIGGSYNEGPATYYRIDFAKDIDTDADPHTHTWQYMPLMRNNSYTITITDITGDGHDTEDDALHSAPSNIDTRILDWEENDMSVEGSDGTCKLKLSQRTFTLSGDAHTAASTGNELIVTTDYSGGWKAEIFDDQAGTTATNSGWLTLSQSSASAATPNGAEINLLAPVNPSTGTDRTAWIHITAGAIKLKVEVTQERFVNRGQYAAPGVIGYIKGTNTLTIRGSKEYAGTPVVGANGNALATGLPLENETVYLALFRWGSLVATGTEYVTTTFEPRDIVAAPKDYNNLGDAGLALAAIKELAAGGPGGTNTGAAAWGTDANQTIPFRGETTGGQALGWTLDAAGGLGDPCEYYFGDGWKLPMGNPWFKDGGTPFGARVTTTGWTTVNAGGNYLGSSPLYSFAGASLYFGVDGAVGGNGEGSPDWSMFLPILRNWRGPADGAIAGNSSGIYWSSTANSSTNGSSNYASSSSTSSRGNGQDFGYGAGVRCVKSTPATTLSVTPTERVFDWDAFDRGQSQVFTVAADGAWTTVIPSSAMNNFEIKQYTAQGTFVTTVNYNELYAFFGFGNGTIVVTPRSNNSSTTTDRTFAFTVEAIGATAPAAAPKTVTVTQERKPVPGVRNVGTAEGVIGYIHRPGHPDHHKLTFAKDDGDDTDGIVYVAYFKFGSLVATSSEDHGAFTSNDVIAWPSEWKSTTDNRTALKTAITGSSATAWKLVPVIETSDGMVQGQEISTVAKVTAANGLGDPCQYYAGDLGSGWRLPTAKENVAFVGRAADASWNNGSVVHFGTSNFPGVWTDGTAPSTTTPGMGNFPVQDGGGRTAFSESIPAAGYRSTSGSISRQGLGGPYWSSTAYSGSCGYYLSFNNSNVNPAIPAINANDYAAAGFSVRCVQPPVPVTHLVFDQTNSNSANITGHGTGPILDIIAGMRRALVKQTGTGEVTIAYLDNNNSTLYADGTPADLTGAEGDVMVYKPEFWYKYVPTPAGADTFGYDIAAEQPADAASWIHSPASLIGAFKSNMVGNMLYSRSGVAPTGNISQANSILYAQARGTGYGIIDYEQHSMIALLFYAKYGNRNSQAVLGAGSGGNTAQNGATIGLGNGDTAGATTTGYASFAGIERVQGGGYEWVDGVTINDGVWTITDPDGSTRSVTGVKSSGIINEIAASDGPYFDLTPTAIGGTGTTNYYADYYMYASGSSRVLARSCGGTSSNGGVSSPYAYYDSSYTNVSFASRLAFRGTIKVASSVSAFKAVSANN